VLPACQKGSALTDWRQRRWRQTGHCYIQRNPNRMTSTPESRREQYDRHAAECLNLVKFSRDPAVRATFTAMAATWLMLAEEASPNGC
jgi:hypothetical protein